MNKLTLEQAREMSAQCWCDPETSHIEMIPELCESFAKRLVAALEAADKQGEPVAYRFTENRGDGKTEFSYYTPEELATAYRDNCLAITPLYTHPQPIDRKATEDEVIERCAKVCSQVSLDIQMQGESLSGCTSYVADRCAEVVRALKGSK